MDWRNVTRIDKLDFYEFYPDLIKGVISFVESKLEPGIEISQLDNVDLNKAIKECLSDAEPPCACSVCHTPRGSRLLMISYWYDGNKISFEFGTIPDDPDSHLLSRTLEDIESGGSYEIVLVNTKGEIFKTKYEKDIVVSISDVTFVNI